MATVRPLTSRPRPPSWSNIRSSVGDELGAVAVALCDGDGRRPRRAGGTGRTRPAPRPGTPPSRPGTAFERARVTRASSARLSPRAPARSIPARPAGGTRRRVRPRLRATGVALLASIRQERARSVHGCRNQPSSAGAGTAPGRQRRAARRSGSRRPSRSGTGPCPRLKTRTRSWRWLTAARRPRPDGRGRRTRRARHGDRPLPEPEDRKRGLPRGVVGHAACRPAGRRDSVPPARRRRRALRATSFAGGACVHVQHRVEAVEIGSPRVLARSRG